MLVAQTVQVDSQPTHTSVRAFMPSLRISHMTDLDNTDWNDVRFFLAAAHAGTLAGAGRVLGVEHSTVSRRLRALEQTLGGPVVLRGPDGLQLTPLGERLLPVAKQVNDAFINLRTVAVSDQTRVRLAVPSGFVELFTARLASLHDSMPDLVLEIISGARGADIMRNEADLAVRSGPITDPELVARKVAHVGWSLYASPDYLRDHPLENPADLRDHRVIGYDPTLSESPPAKWIEANARQIVLRSREMVDMASAANTGAGIALLPCVIGDPAPGLVRLTPQVLVTRDMWLVYRRESRLSLAVREVIRFTIETMTHCQDALLGAKHSA
jgi:DNA-binding transcriptional LysR family regulator